MEGVLFHAPCAYNEYSYGDKNGGLLSRELLNNECKQWNVCKDLQEFETIGNIKIKLYFPYNRFGKGFAGKYSEED